MKVLGSKVKIVKKFSFLISCLFLSAITQNIDASEVAFIRGGGVSSEEMRQSIDYVNSTFRVDSIQFCSSNHNESISSILESIPCRAISNSAVIVELVNIPLSKSLAFRSFYTNNLSVININVIRPSSGPGVDVASLYRARIERVAVYAVGRALGLQPCPTIFCAMHPSSNSVEFDAKARNLCPPCLCAAQKELKSRGVALRAPGSR